MSGTIENRVKLPTLAVHPKCGVAHADNVTCPPWTWAVMKRHVYVVQKHRIKKNLRQGDSARPAKGIARAYISGRGVLEYRDELPGARR